MKVLLISHTCMSQTEGQPKAEQLARLPDMELCVLTPDRWHHYGTWRHAEPALSDTFAYRREKIALAWTGPGQWYLHHYPRLARLLREFQPDIIDVWEEPYGLVSAHVCRLRNRILPGAKIVAESEQNIDKKLPPPFAQFRAYTLRHADFGVGRSAEAVEVLRANGYKGPAEVVPNAVDADLFRPLDRAACREELGLTGFVVGYVGRLVEEKGLQDLVEALIHCPPDVNLLFVGAGALQAELEQQALRLNKTGQIKFLSARPLEQLPRLMNAMDLLALPSRTTSGWKEQFGRVLIEAQACGTPVLGSDSGAIPDVVGAAGMIVGERDPVALARAIGELQACPERREAMGQRGREQVEARYTWAQVATRMHTIYRSLV